MCLLGSIFIITSLLVLYLKYRAVFTGEKCKGKIIDIVEQNAGYSVGGVNVKKHAYIVKIKNKKYYTAHGCFFLSLGKRKVGKEISVFKRGNNAEVRRKKDGSLTVYEVKKNIVTAQ